jgi:hypothetical protein
MGRIEDAIGGGRITPAQITDLFFDEEKEHEQRRGVGSSEL